MSKSKRTLSSFCIIIITVTHNGKKNGLGLTHLSIPMPISEGTQYMLDKRRKKRRK